jgi:PAS domain S-box-containing protein/diguanylate cyclase (GGDEF)-like protein
MSVAAPPPLRVLLVEDSAADAELILRALQALPAAIEHARVASAAALRRALAEFAPDVVLSDFSMPGFSGQEALAIAQEHLPGIPFLFVSGTIGEELAIEALQRGAADYVLKENLRRLAPAVERALDIARERRQRQDMERALHDSEERYRTIVESSKDWIWELDAQGLITYSNPGVEQILGYPPASLLGRSCQSMMHADDVDGPGRELYDAIAHGRSWSGLRLRFVHRDGSVRTLETGGLPMRDDNGSLVGYRGIDRDITDLLAQQEHIRHLARLHAVLGALGSAILRAGTRQGVLDEACRVAVEQGGFVAACIGLRDEEQGLCMVSQTGKTAAMRAITDVGGQAGEAGDQLASTARTLALRSARPVIVPDLATDTLLPACVRTQLLAAGIAAKAVLPIGAPPWAVLMLYTDQPQAFDDEEVALFERLANEIDFAVDFISKGERLEYLAYRNPVSGLYNRSAMHERLQAQMDSTAITLALVDIERFAAINESRGRAFGDRLLQLAGQRLRTLIGTGGLVAHPEADSFALAWPVTGAVEAEVARLEELMQEFAREPFALDAEQIRLGLRGGLAVSPDHGEQAEALEHSAASALAEARSRGMRSFAFNAELRGRATRRLALEHELRHAVEHDEFELFYQPKFNAATQRLVGAEALLRWRHPQRGLVSPAEFIPLLEDSALILPVGRWVMAQALRTVLDWRRRKPGLRIAVNVSARELRHPQFLDQVRTLLHPHADDQPLDIELTESLLMDDVNNSMHLLDSLRDLGCKVAIDDFGTGYSSLNYLARLPIDTIKIDHSFIVLLTQSPETLALVTNIINLAHSLSMNVVAEGVEEEEQAYLLRLLRCDVLQGYLLGRPMPAEDFARQLLPAA